MSVNQKRLRICLLATLPLFDYFRFKYIRHTFFQKEKVQHLGRKLYSVCAHEAAHSIFASYRCDLSVHYIKIGKVNQTYFRGVTAIWRREDCSLAEYVCMLMAGPVLEYIIQTPVCEQNKEKICGKNWPWEWVSKFSFSDLQVAKQKIQESSNPRFLLQYLEQNLLVNLLKEEKRINQVILALSNQDNWKLSTEEFLLASTQNYPEYCVKRVQEVQRFLFRRV